MLKSLCLIVAVFGTAYASIQSYAVRGFFKCGDKPMADAQVILYDENTGMFIGQSRRIRPHFVHAKLIIFSVLPDTVMQRDRTGPDGSFALQGESSGAVTDIDPRLRIFHRCAQGDILPTVCSIFIILYMFF